MTRADLKNLHPDDVPLWLSVEMAVWRLALAAKLKLNQVKPTPRRWVPHAQGLCHFAPRNVITISLRNACEVKRRGTFWGDRYSMHQLLDTIAHEAAHLKAGAGAKQEHHGEAFFRAFAEMLTLAEDINIRIDIHCSGCKLEP